jgi:hypothetical protein
MIVFGKIAAVDGGRADVELTGYDGVAKIPALLMQPCGVGGPSAWMPPSVGDTVVVSYDSERPEDSVVLGCVYPDGSRPPKTGHGEAAIEADAVYLGSSVAAARKCPRDDRLQRQLAAIKAELDALTLAFNAHTHVVPAITQKDCALIVGGATGSGAAGLTIIVPAPVAPHAQAYSVGQTESESVWVY